MASKKLIEIGKCYLVDHKYAEERSWPGCWNLPDLKIRVTRTMGPEHPGRFVVSILSTSAGQRACPHVYDLDYHTLRDVHAPALTEVPE